MPNPPAYDVDFLPGEVLVKTRGKNFRFAFSGPPPMDFAAAVVAIRARIDAQDARQVEHDAKLDAVVEALNRLASLIPPDSFLTISPKPVAPADPAG